VSIDPNEWILRQFDNTTDVGDHAPITALELSAPWPNPSRAGTHFTIALPRAGQTRVVVVDAAGRRVASLADRAPASSPPSPSRRSIDFGNSRPRLPHSPVGRSTRRR
jgi:hypothetical protein